MSRILKFRAWDKKHRKYAKVLKIYFGSGGSNLGALVEDYETNYALELQANQVEFEQYTGLDDKNGVPIYEGDIIQETILADDTTDGTYRYEVYWDEDTLCWSIKGISDIDYHLRNDLWETNASREVISNIHEKDKLVDFDHVEGGKE